MHKPKGPQPQAVGKMREIYNRIRNRPLAPDKKKELTEIFKKENRVQKKTPKKIARSDSETEASP